MEDARFLWRPNERQPALLIYSWSWYIGWRAPVPIHADHFRPGSFCQAWRSGLCCRGRSTSFAILDILKELWLERVVIDKYLTDLRAELRVILLVEYPEPLSYGFLINCLSERWTFVRCVSSTVSDDVATEIEVQTFLRIKIFKRVSLYRRTRS